jgi:acyl-CoA thioesterase-1
MPRILWSIVAVLALAGCGSAAPAPTPSATPSKVSSAAPPASASPAALAGPVRHILAFGDSLFAGHRLAPGQGYPERLQSALRARGINAEVTDAGVSGNTTADGRQRIRFVLNSLAARPDLALVELGGNDLLRGLSPQDARANLAAILDQLKARHIPVLLMGMKAPPNAGPEYQAQFDAIYPALAKQYHVRLVPFFLRPIYDRPALLQADHIHPTAQGVDALVAATVEDVARALPGAAVSRAGARSSDRL